MQIQLLRHATLIVEIGGQILLVDPMLSEAGAMEPVVNAAVTQRIPLVPLPLDDDALATLLRRVDAVLVTHTHRDHWDNRAKELLPRNLKLFCQPEDEAHLRGEGFEAVEAVDNQLTWRGLRIIRTSGHHGTGEIEQKMGPVSGFVLQSSYGEPSLYIAGDTVWCAEVAEALLNYRPQLTVVNAGAAQFLSGGPITMTAQDVVTVCRQLPTTQVIAVHMEAINHCLLTRTELRRILEAEGLNEQITIPADGEVAFADDETQRFN